VYKLKNTGRLKLLKTVVSISEVVSTKEGNVYPLTSLYRIL
jgi:hypothetical protein